jgi:hypothetical protein
MMSENVQEGKKLPGCLSVTLQVGKCWRGVLRENDLEGSSEFGATDWTG